MEESEAIQSISLSWLHERKSDFSRIVGVCEQLIDVKYTLQAENAELQDRLHNLQVSFAAEIEQWKSRAEAAEAQSERLRYVLQASKQEWLAATRQQERRHLDIATATGAPFVPTSVDISMGIPSLSVVNVRGKTSSSKKGNQLSAKSSSQSNNGLAFGPLEQDSPVTNANSCSQTTAAYGDSVFAKSWSTASQPLLFLQTNKTKRVRDGLKVKLGRKVLKANLRRARGGQGTIVQPPMLPSKASAEKLPSCDANVFCCSICNGEFVRKRALLEHLWIHKNVRPFNCSFCTRTFLRSNERSRHERSAHLRQVRLPQQRRKQRLQHYACKLILKQKQIRMCLTNNGKAKLLHCDVCGRRYLHQNELTLHRRAHTDPANGSD